jgi:hypothetical protein
MERTTYLEHFEITGGSKSNIGGYPYYLNVRTPRYRILITEKDNKSDPEVKVMMYENKDGICK